MGVRFVCDDAGGKVEAWGEGVWREKGGKQRRKDEMPTPVHHHHHHYHTQTPPCCRVVQCCAWAHGGQRKGTTQSMLSLAMRCRFCLFPPSLFPCRSLETLLCTLHLPSAQVFSAVLHVQRDNSTISEPGLYESWLFSIVRGTPSCVFLTFIRFLRVHA